MSETASFIEIVGAIGTGRFGQALMTVLADRTGADMCSAFALATGAPEILVAESVQPDRSPFAWIASLRYAKRHWRNDRPTLYNLGRAHRTALLARRSAKAIDDIDYRRECYTAGDVGERLSVCRAGDTAFILNAYRGADGARFSPEAASWIEAHGPLLIASLARHAALTANATPSPDPAALARHLNRREPGLSPREAQVLARTALGETREATARALALSVTTVATYRQRAYSKLGVRDREGLRALVVELS